MQGFLACIIVAETVDMGEFWSRYRLLDSLVRGLVPIAAEGYSNGRGSTKWRWEASVSQGMEHLPPFRKSNQAFSIQVASVGRGVLTAVCTFVNGTFVYSYSYYIISDFHPVPNLRSSRAHPVMTILEQNIQTTLER